MHSSNEMETDLYGLLLITQVTSTLCEEAQMADTNGSKNVNGQKLKVHTNTRRNISMENIAIRWKSQTIFW